MLKQVIKTFVGEDRYLTAVKLCNFYDRNKVSTVYIANGEDRLVDACVASPLAALENAPILLTKYDDLSYYTYIELKRLQPSKIVIIGGEGQAVSAKTEQTIKEACPSATVQRIGGLDRYETCLYTAQKLKSLNSIHTIYIVGDADADADGLSIAPVAGMEKQPILITKKDSLPADIKSWLKQQTTIKNCYIIGGTLKISDSVARELEDILNINVIGNRVSGEDRKQTNAQIIKRFFTKDTLDSVFLTKAWTLVDSASAGPLAALKKGPIILCDDNLNNMQLETIATKQCKNIYVVGGGVDQEAIETIKKLLK